MHCCYASWPVFATRRRQHVTAKSVLFIIATCNTLQPWDPFTNVVLTWIRLRMSWECRDRYLAVSFDVSGGEIVPDIPDTCATGNFTYLVRSPYAQNAMLV